MSDGIAVFRRGCLIGNTGQELGVGHEGFRPRLDEVLIEKDDAGYRAGLAKIDPAQLPEGDVTVRVARSSLNFKDGLAITGKSPVVRSFPMVPGIELAGTVEESSHAEFKAGDLVVLNGWGVGENHWGGLAQFARLKGDWLVPLPSAFTPAQAMAIGTAGYTAMLCVLALERHGVAPDHGEIPVTGAAGGVGSVAAPGGSLAGAVFSSDSAGSVHVAGAPVGQPQSRNCTASISPVAQTWFPACSARATRTFLPSMPSNRPRTASSVPIGVGRR